MLFCQQIEIEYTIESFYKQFWPLGRHLISARIRWFYHITIHNKISQKLLF